MCDRSCVELPTVVAIIIALVLLWAVLLVVFWLLRPTGVTVRELLGLIPDILRLLRSLIGDRSAPLDVRLVLIGLVAWILSPIDLIPEFIPVLGPMDDAIGAIVGQGPRRRRGAPPPAAGGAEGRPAALGRVRSRLRDAHPGHRFGPDPPRRLTVRAPSP